MAIAWGRGLNFWLVAMVSGLFLASTCLAGERPAPPAGVDLEYMPKLQRGQVLGTTIYGSADLESLSSAAEIEFQRLIDGGMRGFTLYVDWPDLESAPGMFALGELLNSLDMLSDLGLQVFLNITVGNIGDYNLPTDLSDGEGGLAPGVQLNQPSVIARFGALLDELVPELALRDVFLLGLGNEVDERLDHASLDELNAYRDFVLAGRNHVHGLVPDLPVTVTVTAKAIRDQSATWLGISQAVDLAAFNYAPIDQDWFVFEIADIAADLDQILALAGDGPLVIQELTCPSAPSMGASEQWQSSCLDVLFDRIIANRNIRFVSIFTLEDLGGAVCSAVQDVFLPALSGLPTDFIERFLDYLCAIGIIAEDGSAKPSLNAVLQALDRLPSARTRLRRMAGERPPAE